MKHMNTPFNSAVPHYAVTAWTMDDKKSAKGLNAYKIIQAAAEIADRDGLGAVTIRSIAKHTGFSTMAVYRHVESRDELMLLLLETTLGPAPVFASDIWQDNVRSWATKLLERYAAHPWTLELPIAGIPTMPNHISWVEQILRILAPTGLSLQARLDTALLIDGHVRQFANIFTPNNVKVTRLQNLPWLQEVAADAAPTLMLALQQGVMKGQKGPDFNVGMDTIIKGIEANL
jgi:AcrR family transcriptional regulator